MNSGLREEIGTDAKQGKSLKENISTLQKDVTNKQLDPPFEVKIIRSNRRRKTISARMIKNVMVVYAPAAISDSELGNVVDKFKKRLQKRKLKEELDRTQDLKVIAQRLNKEYFSGRLKIQSIEYAANQKRIFGSCNYKAAKIRVSHRVAKMPHWVRNYVILHEMAHLVESNHSKSFWRIVSRYKLAERAKGYLIAKGLDSTEESHDIE